MSMAHSWGRVSLIILLGLIIGMIVIGVFLWHEGFLVDAKFAWDSYRLEKESSLGFALCEEGATSADLEKLIGSPDEVYPGGNNKLIWYYHGAVCDGRIVKTLSVYVDEDTKRIQWVGGGFHCGPCSLYSEPHLKRIRGMQWLLQSVLGDPTKAGVEGRERGPIVNKGCQPVHLSSAKTSSGLIDGENGARD